MGEEESWCVSGDVKYMEGIQEITIERLGTRNHTFGKELSEIVGFLWPKNCTVVENEWCSYIVRKKGCFGGFKSYVNIEYFPLVDAMLIQDILPEHRTLAVKLAEEYKKRHKASTVAIESPYSDRNSNVCVV